MDFAGSRKLSASAEAVWAVVVDTSRLGEWLPMVSVARSMGGAGAGVELEGESHGHPYTLTSSWDADDAAHRVDWRGNSGDGYEGSLEIVSADAGTSEVRVHVNVPEARIATYDNGEAEIRRGIENAFDRLSALVAN